MLLRASSSALGEDADLRGAVGDPASGVPHGDLLVAYAEAANRDPAAARALDAEMIGAVGEAGLVDAAVTVAVFNGLVRSADGIGIPLDVVMFRATGDARAALGIDDFAGAGNSQAG